jgi:hypothetical protein
MTSQGMKLHSLIILRFELHNDMKGFLLNVSNPTF